MRMTSLLALAVLAAAAAAGCSQKPAAPDEYKTVADDPRRDTDAARRLNDQAADLLAAGKLDEAEGILKQALRADLFFGPAHNNLGTLHFRRDRLYKAAWEYQYAARLMPHAAEPRNNLGLVFESAGRPADALAHYTAAREMAPDNPHILANLTRAKLRAHHPTTKTRPLLQEIALKHPDQAWRTWAQNKLATMTER